MTVIAGIKNSESVFLMGDRGASDGSTIVSLTTPKLWRQAENIICGYAGSGGVGQMIQYMTWPVLDTDNIPSWMRTHLVPSIVSEKEKRAAKEGDEAGLLIGIKGKKKVYLFEMDTSDYSIWEFNYTAIGSGGAVALGSLFTTNKKGSVGDEKERLSIAIDSSIEHVVSCKGGKDFLSI